MAISSGYAAGPSTGASVQAVLAHKGRYGWAEVEAEAELKSGSSMCQRKGLRSARRGSAAPGCRRDHWEVSFVGRKEK
jgi:hypothetical protein